MKVAAIILVFAGYAIAADCDSLKSLKLTHITITGAEAREPGSFTAPYGGRPVPNLPAFCRVTGTIKPTDDSDIRFEVWLPASNWNGKFQGIGNGGFAGTIGYASLADAVAHGYASASTDTGHQATTQTPNAEWALNHPEKIADFGYRAIHETAVAAKHIVAAFYGDSPQHSYFNSCSNGGRQALMEAERYPADYDGIIAGAPANYWTHLVSAAAIGVKATLSEAASYIPASKLPAIESAALAQCDALDGVKDGVIENPLACHFDPSVLRCKGAESDACLTGPQLTALVSVYGGLKNGKGQQTFPGLSPGGEAEPGGWGAWVTGDAPQKSQMYYFSTQFFENMVFNDPAWRFQSFDPDRDVKAADDKLAGILNSTNPDLMVGSLQTDWHDQTENISSNGGVCFRSVRRFEPGEKIHYVITLSKTGLTHVKLICCGVIVRCVPLDSSAEKTFEIAMTMQRYRFARPDVSEILAALDPAVVSRISPVVDLLAAR